MGVRDICVVVNHNSNADIVEMREVDPEHNMDSCNSKGSLRLEKRSRKVAGEMKRVKR